MSQIGHLFLGAESAPVRSEQTARSLVKGTSIAAVYVVVTLVDLGGPVVAL